MATTKRTPKTPAGPEVPLPAPDDAVTVDPADTVTADDLTSAVLVRAVPGLTGTPHVAPSPPNFLERPSATNQWSVVGNIMVSLPPAGVEQVMTVQVLPMVDPNTGVRDPDPEGVDFCILVDVLNGTVPTEDGITRKLKTPPLVVREFKVDEAIWEQTTQKYFVCTSAGSTVPTNAAVATFEASAKDQAAYAALYNGLAVFEVRYAEVYENLDDWDDLWEPDLDYTFLYEDEGKKGRNADGTFAAVVTLPIDPLDATDALYTTAIKAAAAKTVFWTDATFVAGVMPPKKCETDAEWAAHFDLVYKDANDRYHPSVVSNLRSAILADADKRPNEYYQLADDLADPVKTGQQGYVDDKPGMAADLKQADDSTLIKPIQP